MTPADEREEDFMNRLTIKRLTTLSAFLLLSVLATPTEAHSRHPYSMEILVDGVPVDAHHAWGKTYIEAEEGREYSIRLRNHTSFRG